MKKKKRTGEEELSDEGSLLGVTVDFEPKGREEEVSKTRTRRRVAKNEEKGREATHTTS